MGGSSYIPFKFPGFRPDLRVKVFNNTFRVHSHVLCLHSGFFRKHFDPNQEGVIRLSGEFPRYFHTEVIPRDQTWKLVPSTKALSKETVFIFPNPQIKEKREHDVYLFFTLLRAMYKMPYDINTACDIGDLNNIAATFGVQPCISRSLTSALARSPIFSYHAAMDGETLDFAESANGVLYYALDLRHKQLYYECFVHMCSRQEMDHANRAVQEILKRGIKSVVRKRGKVILEWLSFVNASNFPLSAIGKFTQSSSFGRSEDSWPEAENFVIMKKAIERYIEKNPSFLEPSKAIRHSLDMLLKNQLTLDKSGCEVGEKGPYRQRLLCADLPIIPWDEDEHVW